VSLGRPYEKILRAFAVFTGQGEAVYMSGAQLGFTVERLYSGFRRVR
jgi:hypothetical protein